MRVIRLASALWLVCAPAFALAAGPIGNFDFTLGGKQSIWLGEIGGDDFCESFWEGLEGLEHCDVELAIDGKGRITGSVDLAASDGSARITLRGSLKGSQRGDGRTGLARTSLSLQLEGELSEGDLSLALKADFKYAGQVAPGGVATGIWNQRLCVEGSGCTRRRIDAPTQILTSGDWQVELAIADAGGGALTGDARLEFGDGSECFYTIQGGHRARSDVADLALIPITPACAETSIELDGVAIVGPLPAAPRSGNQAVFAFICEGTVTIAASVDPSACAWSPFGELPPGTESEQPLRIGKMKYKLFGFSGEGYVYSRGNAPSYGRATFIWLPKHATIFDVVSNRSGLDPLLYPLPGEPLPP